MNHSKDDIDEYAAVLAQISKEAYENPEIVKTAPIDHPAIEEMMRLALMIRKWAVTWRAYGKHLSKTKMDSVS